MKTLIDKVETAAVEVLKATPATSTIGLSLFGIPLSQWATILSILLLLLQAYFLIRNNTGGRRDTDKK